MIDVRRLGPPCDMDFGRRVLQLPEGLLARVLRRVPRSVLRAMSVASKELARAARLGVAFARLGVDFAHELACATFSAHRWLLRDSYPSRIAQTASSSFDPVSAFPGLRTVELNDRAMMQMPVANLLLTRVQVDGHACADHVEFVRRWRELSLDHGRAATVLLPHCRDLLRLDLRLELYDDVPLSSLTRLTALRCASDDWETFSYDAMPATISDLTLEFFVAPSDLRVLAERLPRLTRLSLVASEALEEQQHPRPAFPFPNLRHFTCAASERCDDGTMSFLAGAMPRDLESLALLRRGRPIRTQVSDLSCWTESCPRLSTFTCDLGWIVPDLRVAACIAGMSHLNRLHVCGNCPTAVHAASLARLSRLEEVTVNAFGMASLLEDYRVAFRAGWKVRLVSRGDLAHPFPYVSRWWVRDPDAGGHAYDDDEDV